MYPEVIPSLGDIEKIGLDYFMSSPDSAPNILATIPLERGSAKSLFAKATMRSIDSNHFAQFQIAGVYCNKDGEISEKFQSDTIVNRDNPNNFFYFQKNGENIEVVGVSGIDMQTEWSGLIAVIAV